MHIIKQHIFYLLLLPAIFFCGAANAQLQFNGLPFVLPAEQELNVMAQHSMDSIYTTHPMLTQKTTYIAIEHVHSYHNQAMDFYLLLVLFAILGLIRYTNPRYFSNLWRAFTNTTLSSRQLKEQLEGDGMMSLLMNIFFTVVAGAYMYYTAGILMPQRTQHINPSILLLALTAGIMVIYLGKYATMRLSGWAFHVEQITDNYIFNIFLVNKITGIALLPIVVFLAFANPVWAGPALIVSGILIVLMFINRYIRSWQVFGSFFQFSRFHFFMYLCASELLPLAVLMKLLMKALAI